MDGTRTRTHSRWGESLKRVPNAVDIETPGSNLNVSALGWSSASQDVKVNIKIKKGKHLAGAMRREIGLSFVQIKLCKQNTHTHTQIYNRTIQGLCEKRRKKLYTRGTKFQTPCLSIKYTELTTVCHIEICTNTLRFAKWVIEIKSEKWTRQWNSTHSSEDGPDNGKSASNPNSSQSLCCLATVFVRVHLLSTTV